MAATRTGRSATYHGEIAVHPSHVGRPSWRFCTSHPPLASTWFDRTSAHASQTALLRLSRDRHRANDCRMVAAGGAQAIEKATARVVSFASDVARPLAQLSVLIEGRHVLLRQGEGLIEPGGQLRFDFDDDSAVQADDAVSPSTLPFQFPPSDDASLVDEDDLLAQAFWAEDQGDLQTAIDLCHAIMARDGIRADICFQLGELLYRDGQIDAARERYYAAIELDEGFIEARTNLGCVLAETGRTGHRSLSRCTVTTRRFPRCTLSYRRFAGSDWRVGAGRSASKTLQRIGT